MILVGTVHTDLNGPRRLETLLKICRPKSVSTEVSSSYCIDEVVFQINEAKKRAIEIVNNAKLEESNKQLALEVIGTLCYEAIVPIEYCKANNISVYFVDHPKHRAFWENYLGWSFEVEVFDMVSDLEKNPKKIEEYSRFKKNYAKCVDRLYYAESSSIVIADVLTNASEKFRKKLENCERDDDFEEVREQYLTEAIIEKKPDMNISGIAHVFEGFMGIAAKNPLYASLGDLVTKRIRLCEVDKDF